MKRTAMQHTKLKRLVRDLAVPQYAAVGILESLWHLTAREAPGGNIGKLSNEDIAIWIDWQGLPDALIGSLVVCGWLDADEEHRLMVHDWQEHADDATKKAIARKKPATADMSRHVQTCPDNGGQNTPASALPEPVPEPVKTHRVKAASVELPSWVNEESWEGYLDVRRKKRAVMTERALHAILGRLEEFRARGHDPNAILATSMRSNWTDVYEPKGAANGFNQGNQVRGNQHVEQAIAELRKSGVEVEGRRTETGPVEDGAPPWGSDGCSEAGVVLEGAR